MGKERVIGFDIVKCIAIYLVVLGHCLQYLGHSSMTALGLQSYIYAFHMPLFFMVSGYFASQSWSISPLSFIGKKSLQLLLPCVVWGILLIPFRGIDDISWLNILSLQWFPLWFLRELFKMQLWIYLVVKIAKEKMYVAFLLSLLVYFLPFCAILRLMLPFFWVGYLIHQHWTWIISNRVWLTIVLVVLSVLSLMCWNPSWLENYYYGIEYELQDLISIGCGSIYVITTILSRMVVALVLSLCTILLCAFIKTAPDFMVEIGEKAFRAKQIYEWIHVKNVASK